MVDDLDQSLDGPEDRRARGMRFVNLSEENRDLTERERQWLNRLQSWDRYPGKTFPAMCGKHWPATVRALGHPATKLLSTICRSINSRRSLCGFRLVGKGLLAADRRIDNACGEGGVELVFRPGLYHIDSRSRKDFTRLMANHKGTTVFTRGAAQCSPAFHLRERPPQSGMFTSTLQPGAFLPASALKHLRHEFLKTHARLANDSGAFAS